MRRYIEDRLIKIERKILWFDCKVSINFKYITFSRFMLLIHARLAIFLLNNDDNNRVVYDDDSNDNDIT